jgi:activating signal cointegrator complex subunit 3
VAVILVHEPKKNFYKKFLYEPFPVESSLLKGTLFHSELTLTSLKVFHDHLNAEIVSGTISSKQDAIDYLTWTYFFRRLMMNPSYYELEDTSFESINQYLSEKVDSAIEDLVRAGCIGVGDDDLEVFPK